MSQQNIVVGVDFSESSRVALAEAVHLTKIQKANLHVVHIVNLEFFESELGEKVLSLSLLKEKAYKKLSEFSEPFLQEEISHDLHVYTGHPFYELLYTAQGVMADLLVVGSYGNSGKSDRVGTIAARFVRKANMPVLLVREGKESSYEKIVACCDFSETSRRAIHHAAEFALQHKVALQVVHVHVPYENMVIGLYGEVPMLTEDFYKDYALALEKELADFMNPVRREFPLVSIQTTITKAKSASAGICQFLKETEADLAVLGTRGRTGIKTLLLGTTVERVIHRCPCSVLTIKPKDFHYKA